MSQIITDYQNDCLHIINKNGQFLGVVDRCGLNEPSGRNSDRKGRLWVGLCHSGTIKVLEYLKSMQNSKANLPAFVIISNSSNKYHAWELYTRCLSSSFFIITFTYCEMLIICTIKQFLQQFLDTKMLRGLIYVFTNLNNYNITE